MPKHGGPAGESTIEADVAVIGGGPAGVSASVAARAVGARVVMIDEGARVGGQIWRHRTGADRQPAATRWIERLEASGATILSGATVFAITPRDAGTFGVLTECDAKSVVVRARSIVLATGARELLLPFPGWTLPGVLGIGGLQALVKSGLDVAGKRVALLGSGALMMPVAALLAKKGAQLVIVGEQAPFGRVARFGMSLAGSPATLIEAARYRMAFAGTRYRTGVWAVRADGRDRVSQVMVTDGRREWAIDCDYLGVGFGLVPNLEVARMLDCEVVNGVVRVDANQRTSVDHVWAAGEAVGVAGVHAATAEGVIAGRTATDSSAADDRDASTARRVRDRARRHGRAMHQAFALREELRSLATPDCIVCRCEDVPLGAIDPAWSPRQAKLYRRVGMGPCQGRVCGAAMQFLRGWEPDSVRPPLQPALVSTFLDAHPSGASTMPDSSASAAHSEPT